LLFKHLRCLNNNKTTTNTKSLLFILFLFYCCLSTVSFSWQLFLLAPTAYSWQLFCIVGSFLVFVAGGHKY
jgi:hypothetical protein